MKKFFAKVFFSGIFGYFIVPEALLSAASTIIFPNKILMASPFSLLIYKGEIAIVFLLSPIILRILSKLFSRDSFTDLKTYISSLSFILLSLVYYLYFISKEVKKLPFQGGEANMLIESFTFFKWGLIGLSCGTVVLTVFDLVRGRSVRR